MKAQYRYLEDFLNKLRSKGRYSFSLPELRTRFPISDEAVKKALQRLKKKKEIALVRKEFYVIVTPEYISRGILPPSLFIADMMKFLQKDYYVGLLNAAAFYGAAHQQPQDFSVITSKPSLREIKSDKLKINFYTKKSWAREDIIQKKVETGYLQVSSPELTALDLVFYFDQAGGFNRIATVLEELSETIDAIKLAETAKRFCQIAAVQRLGFLLDEILQHKELAMPLSDYLKTVNHFPVLLRPQKQKPENMVTGNLWKVVPNIQIEPDL
jgi:predicted transcriptional regulator of viral defense system